MPDIERLIPFAVQVLAILYGVAALRKKKTEADIYEQNANTKQQLAMTRAFEMLLDENHDLKKQIGDLRIAQHESDGIIEGLLDRIRKLESGLNVTVDAVRTGDTGKLPPLPAT